GEVVVEPVEADDALVVHALGRLPHDAVVLAPLGDPAFPLALAEPDLLLPAQLVAALPLDALHAVHELRELVELRPLLVSLLDGNGHIGPALDRQAARLLAAATAPTGAGKKLGGHLAEPAAALLEAGRRAFDGLPAEPLGAVFALLLGRLG